MEGTCYEVWWLYRTRLALVGHPNLKVEDVITQSVVRGVLRIRERRWGEELFAEGRRTACTRATSALAALAAFAAFAASAFGRVA